MKNKICFKCSIEKPLDDFYKHPEMPDGHINKCKECNKKDCRENYAKKIEDDGWVEKENLRNKERRKRLNYTQKAKDIWNVGKPWRESRVYKSLRKKKYSKLKNFYKLHHWNYNDEFLEDIFIMKSREHRLLHNYLTLDLEKRIFYLEDGTYLDTKEKHKEYIESLNFFIGRVNDKELFDE